MYISCRCLGSCFHPFSKCFIISPWLVHDRKISVISSSLFSQLIFILASNAMSPPSKPWKRPKRLVTDLIAIPFESLEHMYMTTTHVCGIDCISYIYIYISTYVYILHICIYICKLLYLLHNIHLHIWALLGWGFDTWRELLQLRAFTFQISKEWKSEQCVLRHV